jgi:hypothetical protein
MWKCSSTLAEATCLVGCIMVQLWLSSRMHVEASTCVVPYAVLLRVYLSLAKNVYLLV